MLLMLAVLGVSALYLSQKRSASSHTPSLPTQSQTATSPAPTAPIVGAGEKATQEKLGEYGAGLARAGAQLASGNYFGAAIATAEVGARAQGEFYNSLVGGGPSGKIASALAYTPAQFGAPIVAGATVGREIDKALGGTGEGLRGYTAQACGGVVGAIFACCGAIAGYYCASFAAVVYGIFVAIDDENRKAWTRDGGPLREYLAARVATYEKLYAALREKDADAKLPELQRFCVHFADGYHHHLNELNYRRAMRLAWGIGATYKTHADWQVLRGYFIGSVDANGNMVDNKLPWRGRENDFLSMFVPPTERILLSTSKQLTSDAQQKLIANPVLGFPGSSFLADSKNYEAVSVYKDKAADAINTAGRVMANASSYVDWMQQTWGVGQTELTHAQWGKREGRFEGDLLPDGPFRWVAQKGTSRVNVSGTGGRLLYLGKEIYYRDEGGEVGIYVKLYDAPK